MRTFSAIFAAAAALLPAAAFAHAGADHGGGFAGGFLHPAGGLDHVLAMVMVGVLAWQIGGRARWLVPAAFVAVMALGGLAGAAGVALPLVEAGIALSVVALGLAIATGARWPVAAAMGMAGLFAVFHGHAHGAEMPAGTGAAAYAAGFLAATALLHGAGLALGALVGRAGMAAVRGAGAAAALAGVAILAGVL
ncbi:HupE/UreJ family protein [Stella sp.]|uniref:HupE/UreJ family protein n=1 Tax=Stella sp. TaxID=2912054 RepID=UPI0035AE57F3